MYKIFKAGGKDYKLEYTLQTTLYEECSEKLMVFLASISAGDAEDENKEEKTYEEIIQKRLATIKQSVSGLAKIPQTALTLLYAGLLEHHGTGKNGDGTVRSKDDALEIASQFIEEHKEDGTGNFYDILTICLEQMGDDNFFKKAGLESVLGQIATPTTASPNREQRRAAAKQKA